MIFLNKYREYIILSLIYFIANILLLLNINGIYWDDWVLFGHTYETINNIFYPHSGNAGIIDTSIHTMLLDIGNGVYSYRILTYIFYFIIPLFLFSILKNIKHLSQQDVFFITIIFMLSPLNSAKVALIDFLYGFDLLVFFLGFYLLSKNLYNNNYILRITILILFFFSFLTNSLLVFYAIPLMYIFYIKYSDKDYNFLNKIKLFIIQNIDFILLPVLFFIIKSIYFKPNSSYEGYNSINFIGLLKAPIGILESVYTSFIDPINQSFSLFPYFWFFIVFYILITKETKKVKDDNQKSKNYYKILFIGFIFFILAVFPYVIVGKLPRIFDFESRHQLLIPLGFAFSLYFIIKIIVFKLKLSEYLKKIILYVFIIAFIGQNIYIGYRYKLDWLYQIAMEEQMKLSNIIKNNSTFIVDINLYSKLVDQRNIRFYEHNGRLKKALGEDNRLMINSYDDLEIIKESRDKIQYNFSEWVYQKPIYIEIIPKEESFSYILKLFLYEFMDDKKFRDFSKELVEIKIIKE